MRATLLIIFLALISSCNLDFGEQKNFEKNSEEARQRLKAHLMLGEQENIFDVCYFMNEKGIDPYYLASFKTAPKTIEKVIDQLDMYVDTAVYSLYIPKDSPSWYTPPTDKENEFWTFISEKPGKKELLYFNMNDSTCYYANFSW